MIRGKTLYFASIALIGDAVSAQSHTQHRNSIAVGDWWGVLYHFFKDVIEIKNVKSKTIR